FRTEKFVLQLLPLPHESSNHLRGS
ncbi:unnamed protein product, partial [Arctia plantaginis]